MNWKHALVILAAVCLVTSAVVAQSDTTQISGFVKDPTGSVVPNAGVSIRNETTGLERKIRTNENGYYVASSLPPGFYTMTVEVQGFKKYVKTQNKLDSNIPSTVDANLEVGTVAETVEVVASVTQLQSETATVGKLIEEKQIKNIMLNGRNPLYLAQLKPGVRGGSMSAFSFGLTTAGLNINGGRTQDLVITFDGAIGVRTRANGTSIGVADVETVQEIQILTANYTAEYGRSSGGQVRFVTKSGGRDFHGSLYEYFRNEKLDANTWLQNRQGAPRPANKFNQFGYILSGPLYIPGKWNTGRDKLFWLWSQEWVRHRREQSTTIVVPTLAMRGGNFSELLGSNQFFSTARVINDPTTGQPFAGNIIPQARLSSNGVAFLRSYPEPLPGFQLGRSNFFQVRPNPTDQRKDTVSIDFIPSQQQTFRVRWQNFEFDVRDAFRGGTDRAVTQLIRPNDTVSLNHIFTVSPRTVNEFTATAAADRVLILVQREGGRFERSKYGINYPYIFPQRKEIFDKIPTVEISDFASVDGGPYPSASSGPVYTISNITTRVAGSHTFKWGVNFERTGQNDFDQINVSGVPGGTNNQNGRFVFTNARAGAPTTGIAIGNAALGLFDTYAEIGPRANTPYRGQMLEFFGQDSWKVTPKFRAEVGLRWTVMHPYFYSLWGNIAAFDPSRYDPSKAVVQDPRNGNILGGDRFNGVYIPGTGFPDSAKGRVPIADTGEFNRLFSGGPTYVGKVQYRNFQPRIGLAYQINSRNVLRAGFGRFMARPGVSDNIFLGGNPPFQPTISIANGSADNPGGGGAATAFPQFFMTSDPVFKIPSAYNWSLTYEREVGFDTTVSLAYVGRTGLHLERERELNQLRTGTLFQPSSAGVNVNALRPFKGFAFIPMGETAARSEYNSFQLEVNRRFTKGLSFGLAYTLSESFDNASGRRDRLYDAYNDRSYWGYSGFDNRHIAVVNFIYEVPFLRGNNQLMGRLLGGWMVTGITQFQTGTPITIGTGDDFPGIGSGDGKPWNRNGNPKLPSGEQKFSQGAGDSNFYFRPRNTDGSAIYTVPANGTFANQTRNDGVLYNVGFMNWNLGLYKDFKPFESHVLKFRAEFFNWPNHPNWGGVDGGPRSATFGKVLSKGAERNVQLSLRYDF